MPMALPHHFEEVVGVVAPTPIRPSLLIGAGMSYGLVPLPWQIVARLQPMQKVVEEQLHVAPCVPLNVANPQALYVWAGEVFGKLLAGGHPEREAKHAIAEVLEVTKDPCWSARAKIPLRGTTERHRVIARLTREGRWYSIWSLNWDLWLERALASVGVEKYKERQPAPLPLPPSWIRWYESWTPSNALAATDQQTVVLYKPHGCVEALSGGDAAFVLTADELKKCLDDQPKPVKDSMSDCFTRHSLVAAGWSAGEPYLQEFFKTSAANRINNVKLTIVDVSPNSDGHEILKTAYGCTSAQSVFHTDAKFPTTDDLFIWMQTRHGLSCLSQVCVLEDRPKFAEWLDKFSSPLAAPELLSFMNEWFDCFLAVWSRLCFNNGHQNFRCGHLVPTGAVPTKRRDEHIPWSDHSCERVDLIAAVNLLLHLDANRGSVQKWSFQVFPGALWNSQSRHLVLPIPVWENGGKQNLAALKPLVESRHWAYQGVIAKVSLLALDHRKAAPIVSDSERSNWTYEVSRLMHFGKLAQSACIEWLTLEEWTV